MKKFTLSLISIFFCSLFFVSSAFAQEQEKTGEIKKEVMKKCEPLYTKLLQGNIFDYPNLGIRYYPNQVSIEDSGNGARIKCFYSKDKNGHTKIIQVISFPHKNSIKRFTLQEDYIHEEHEIDMSDLAGDKEVVWEPVYNKRGKKTKKTKMRIVKADPKRLNTIHIIDTTLYFADEDKGTQSECKTFQLLKENKLELSEAYRVSVMKIYEKVMAIKPPSSVLDNFERWKELRLLTAEEGTEFYIAYYQGKWRNIEDTDDCVRN